PKGWGSRPSRKNLSFRLRCHTFLKGCCSRDLESRGGTYPSLDAITDFQFIDGHLPFRSPVAQPAATRATPAQTSTTPTHRAAPTCSPRMYLAPSVPTT